MNKIILFDVDCTLMDIPGLGKRTFPPMFREVYGKDTDFSPQAQGLADQAIVYKYMTLAGLTKEEIEAKMQEAIRVLIEVFKRDIEKDLNQFILPGVRELLKKLKDDGYRLGLLTGNLEDIAWEKMRRANLEGIFEFGGFGSDAVERDDLVPIARRKAERVLGMDISPENIIVIGDTPKDVSCAKVSGAKFIGVSTGHFSKEDLESHGAEIILPDLSDTEKVMKTIKEL
ncbi:MAG: HAD family hydrolase [Candidatus Aenigmarchaeota archaeon]|nr:HAD family hydrolase [Candidatus Aenigmarchaeota archaeon]